jgi:hypothetical protein
MPSDQVRGAVAALQAFVDANARQDADGMRACLSQGSQEAGGFNGPTPAGIEFRMGEPEPEGERVVIPLEVVAGEGMTDGPPPGTVLDTLRCIMVQEEGQWRFDLMSTMQPMADAAEAAMKEAMGQLGDAMGAAFGAVGEAMSQAFGDGDGGGATSEFSSEPLEFSTWEQAPDVPGAEELVALPEFTPLPGLTAFLAECLGREVPVVADVKGIMSMFNADDPGPLMPWLENEFPRGLVAAIELASRAVPRELERLRSVRIEPAFDWMDRSISVDGADLVYRADFRDTQGWYTEDELAYLVAGSIAAIPPAAGEYPTGMGDQPREDPMPSLETLCNARLPREMRRLSLALGPGGGEGAPVAVDMNWSDFWSTNQFFRNWCVWGIARVIGAVRLAYPEGGEAAPEGLVRVLRYRLGYGEKSATLEDGVLTIEISPDRGEQGCLYEHELCRVLLGQPLRPEAGESGGEGDESGG